MSLEVNTQRIDVRVVLRSGRAPRKFLAEVSFFQRAAGAGGPPHCTQLIPHTVQALRGGVYSDVYCIRCIRCIAMYSDV